MSSFSLGMRSKNGEPATTMAPVITTMATVMVATTMAMDTVIRATTTARAMVATLLVTTPSMVNTTATASWTTTVMGAALTTGTAMVRATVMATDWSGAAVFSRRSAPATTPHPVSATSSRSSRWMGSDRDMGCTATPPPGWRRSRVGRCGGWRHRCRLRRARRRSTPQGIPPSHTRTFRRTRGLGLARGCCSPASSPKWPLRTSAPRGPGRCSCCPRVGGMRHARSTSSTSQSEVKVRDRARLEPLMGPWRGLLVHHRH
mmetsp:Transcript_38467/g.102623  ORF Transcript_38467/g.102623 Transcript_38467/m.102623 type:complete len:260 (-) Transcript_38467:39-818(-)